MTPNIPSVREAVNKLLFQLEDLTDVQHIKLREAIQAVREGK